MYILLEACETPGLLRVIYFGTLLANIVFTIIPIALIVLLMVDFSKAVISGDEKAVKNTKIVVQRIINAMIVFCIPWIVKVFMSILGSAGFDLGGDFIECLNNANPNKISYYDVLLAKEEEEDKKNNSSPSDNSYNNADYKRAADNLIDKIDEEVGKNNNDYKYGNSTTDWCEQFATWALKQVTVNGQSLYQYINNNGSIDDSAASGMWPAFRGAKNPNITFELSKAYGGTYTPKKGDIIWYQWSVTRPEAYCRKKFGEWNKIKKCADHVGIVSDVDAAGVHTIEGNVTGYIVDRRVRNINSDEIVAYGSWYK